DPKAAAFTENFVGQWLGLRDIDATMPSHILYPEYDDMLKFSMLKETYLFFDEILKNDLSLTNFVSSDFTMLNGRLARHYGIPGVSGQEFTKVKLPPDSHRGGVLTMAAVLKVTANGTTTSPILRGAWVLDHLRGEPAVVNGRTMRYKKGAAVDPADVLPDGSKFKDVDEFKRLLLKDKDQLARALAEKLLSYATGAAPAKADRPEIDAIVGKAREK